MSGLFGERFERFENPKFRGCELIEPLGQGGHSRVYLARRRGQEVAVKQWLRPRLDKKERRRIKREVETLKALDHPHIVRYIGLTQDERARPCLVMDFVPGRSLAAILEEDGRLELARLQVIALALVKTLRYLASRGVVHRDIKPDNVILRASVDTPVLVDFSVARSAEDDDAPTLTATGASVGTAPYMAPEQFGGKATPVDARTDIYGLGALLFHCVTGLPPWSRESAWERQQRNPWTEPYPTEDDKATRVRTAAAETPKALARIIQTCLQGDPEARFQSPEALERALMRWIDGPARRREAARKLARATTAALALFLVFLLGFTIRPWLRDEEKKAEAPKIEEIPAKQAPKEVPLTAPSRAPSGREEPEPDKAPTDRARADKPARAERAGDAPRAGRTSGGAAPDQSFTRSKALIEKPREYFRFADGDDRLFAVRHTWPSSEPADQDQVLVGLERWTYKRLDGAAPILEVIRTREAADSDSRWESGRDRLIVTPHGLFEIQSKSAIRLAPFPLPETFRGVIEKKERAGPLLDNKEMTLRVVLSGRRVDRFEAGGRSFEDCVELTQDVRLNGKPFGRMVTTYARGVGVVGCVGSAGSIVRALELKEFTPGSN